MKFSISVLFFGCLATSAVAQHVDSDRQIYFPGVGEDSATWATVSAASQNLNVEALNTAVDFAMARNSSSVVVLVGGKILVERHQELKSPTLRYRGMVRGKDENGHAIEDVASVQKSIVSVLMGIAIEKKLVQLSDPVHKHLGRGWSQATPEQESEITLRHLVTMTSGLSEQLKFVAPPGTKWAYNTTAYSRSLSAISAACGMSPNELTREWLTGPVGMEDSSWIERRSLRDEKVVSNKYGFATTARDLARFGLLVMAQGRWSQKTVLGDLEYIKAATSPSQKMNPSYGYLWWLNGQKSAGPRKSSRELIPGAPKDLFAAQGALGRKCYVVPSRQIVVTRLGDDPEVRGEPKFNEEFWRLLKLATRKP